MGKAEVSSGELVNPHEFWSASRSREIAASGAVDRAYGRAAHDAPGRARFVSQMDHEESVVAEREAQRRFGRP